MLWLFQTEEGRFWFTPDMTDKVVNAHQTLLKNMWLCQ